MQAILLALLIAASAACASRASRATTTQVQVTNWPMRPQAEMPWCWIPSHPDPLSVRDEPYSDPTYGRAYVPRREYEELLQNNKELNMEVRGIRECLEKFRDAVGVIVGAPVEKK